MINKAMKTAMEWQWTQQPKEIDDALAKLRTLMTVNDLSPANKELFVKQTRPVYQQFEASIGKEFLATVMTALG